MKKSMIKIILLCLALCISAGGTIAYLTDTQSAVNVATLGNIKIELIEQERDTAGNLVPFQNNHMLLPAVIKGNLAVDYTTGFWQNVRNTMDKVVSVKNTGNTPAYIRLWFAFEVTEEENFFRDMIQLNKNETDWEWEFLRTGNGYTLFDLDGSHYVVGAATYPQALAANATTPVSLKEVLLQPSATSEDIAPLGEKYSIFVVAQGVQAQGFDTAEEALTGGFGDVTAANHPFDGMSESDAPNDNPNDLPAIPDISDIPEAPAEDFIWAESNGSITISEYIGNDAKVRIPQMIQGKPVTTIDGYAFYDRPELTAVVIPESVTKLYYSVFENCSNLEYANIPSGVTFIPEFLFGGCSSLTSITIPEGVKAIDMSAFSGCSNLVSLTLPDSVTEIGYSAFNGCSRLTSVRLSNSITDISEDAFSHCYSLIASVYENSYALQWCKNNYLRYVVIDQNGNALTAPSALPEPPYVWGTTDDGKKVFIDRYLGLESEVIIPAYIDGKPVVEISSSAFYCHPTLEKITLPDILSFEDCGLLYRIENLTTLEVSATHPNYVSVDGVLFSKDMKTLIQYPQGRKGAYTIPDGVTSIGYSAFSNCSNLTSITISDSVTNIGDSAFSGCSNLTSITISDSVTNIGDSAFYDCSNLTSITLPDSVTNIGSYAFYKCSNLTSITIPDGVTNIGDNAFYGCSNLSKILVDASNKSYTSSDGVLFSKDMKTLLLFPNGKSGHYAIPNGVTGIQDGAFSGNKNFISVSLPDSMTSISAGAFGNSFLTSITIPNGVTSIGEAAFSNCPYLTSIVIPSTVTTIEERAFSYCSGLTSVTYESGMPSSLRGIGYEAFCGCTSLANVTIPGSVTYLESRSFANCDGLTSIMIPNWVSRIEWGAFEGCDNLINIQVDMANGWYTSLDGVLYTKDMKTLVIFPAGKSGDYVIPDGVTDIQYNAFTGCTKPIRVTVPKSMTVIGDLAFSSSSVTSVTIPEGVAQIDYGAFAWCYALTEVTIPNSVKSIDSMAFSGSSNLVVKVYENSYAHQWCEENDVRYEFRYRVLSRGATGDDVVRLQNALINLGYYTGTADGKYSQSTETAIIAFQRANGLIVDGIAGEATQKVLFSDAAVPVPGSTPVPTATIKYVYTGNTGRLALRAEPKKSSTLIEYFESGTQVTVYSDDGTWSYVSVYGMNGYMMSSFLVDYVPEVIPTLTPRPGYATKYVYAENGGDVYLRPQPDTTAYIRKYPVGTQAVVYSDDGTWSYIYIAGQEGYMMSKFLVDNLPISVP